MRARGRIRETEEGRQEGGDSGEAVEAEMKDNMKA
jgi:hypothetical protein